MVQINKIEDLQRLVRNGFQGWDDLGRVKVTERGDLRLFAYTAAAQYQKEWNFFETISRGLILNADSGEIVARPFCKFFNWDERGRRSRSPVKTVSEKMDGSLGILYRDSGEYCIATRGSFDSDQAIWATDFLRQNYNLILLDSHFTLLFEIIYPDNRIVVDYGKREDLVLLAARNRFDGRYLPQDKVEALAWMHGFSLPRIYKFSDPNEIAEACRKLGPTSEGWVVEFEDGQRFKFKGEEYRNLHRMIYGLSFKRTLEYLINGNLDILMSTLPDEFISEVEGWLGEIDQRASEKQVQINSAFDVAPKGSRKEFALWVMETHKDLASYLFAMLDGKPIDTLIYKNILE